MVLPAPPPDDAPRPREATWLARLNGVLQLVQKGVLVLVDDAAPERLGELVRSLLPAHPDLEVHTDAVRLARAEKGSLIVLVPDPAQATWLNLERPIFANRALRVILFSTAETSSVLARRAPDFFSWISHRIECPPGPVLPAVRGIQAALRTRARGIAWMGGDLEGAFSAALPGRALVRASAAMPYEQMVEAAKPAGKSWVVWSDVDGPFRLRRVGWAMAEAGRRGRGVLLEPGVEAPGFPRVDGRLAEIKTACEELEEAGAKHGGRLAALLDLDCELIKVASSHLKAGENDLSLEAAARMTADSSEVRRRLTSDNNTGVGAPSHDSESAHIALVEALGRQRHVDERGWIKAAKAAIEEDDAEVALYWARRGLLVLGDDQEALQIAGDALERCGYYSESEILLRKALALALVEGEERIDQSYATTLVSLARSLINQSRLRDAEKLLRKAVTIERRATGTKHADYANAVRILAGVLRSRGRYAEAEKMTRDAMSIAKQTHGKEHPNYAISIGDLGSTLLARGKPSAAEPLFRESLAVLRKALGTENRHYAAAAHILGRCLLDQHKYSEAETYLRIAAAVYGKVLGQNHLIYASALHELARCLTRQGAYAEAEIELGRALSIHEKINGGQTLAYASSLNQLAVISQYRGNQAHAEQLFRLALPIVEKFGKDDPLTLSRALSNLGLVLASQGQYTEGETLITRSIDVAKKCEFLGPDIGSTMLILARVQAEHGAVEAPETARRALDALRQSLGQKSPEYKSAAKLVEDLADGSSTSPSAPLGPRLPRLPRATRS